MVTYDRNPGFGKCAPIGIKLSFTPFSLPYGVMAFMAFLSVFDVEKVGDEQLDNSYSSTPRKRGGVGTNAVVASHKGLRNMSPNDEALRHLKLETAGCSWCLVRASTPMVTRFKVVALGCPRRQRSKRINNKLSCPARDHHRTGKALRARSPNS